MNVQSQDGQIARLIVGPEGGEVTADPIGYPQRTIADGAMTRGAYSLHEMSKPPGEGPIPHTHDNMDEAFYILEGEFTFTIDGNSVVASAGSFVIAPRGSMHGFLNSGKNDGRYLRFFSPALTEEDHRLWVDLGERVAAARDRNEGSTHEIFLRELTRPRTKGD
jgi:mannose-6-phosphate isomerase-like protein (cupin superfamily)